MFLPGTNQRDSRKASLMVACAAGPICAAAPWAMASSATVGVRRTEGGGVCVALLWSRCSPSLGIGGAQAAFSFLPR